MKAAESLASLSLDASRAYAEFMRFSGLGTVQVLELALQVAKRLGDDLQRARLAEAFGNVALARSDHGEARTRYEAALSLYKRIEEPYSVG